MAATAPTLRSPCLQRSASALGLILSRIRSDGDGPYRGMLTGDGSPVELVFTSRDNRMRYTCDVAGPSVDPEIRLARAQGLLTTLGHPTRFPFPRIQTGAVGLRWGAWLGARHGDRDEFKIYAEVPDRWPATGEAELRGALHRYATLIDSREYKLRIVAASLDAREFYFRTTCLEPAQLSRLLRFMGFGDDKTLLDLIGSASNQAVRLRLPGHQHGFSVALDGEGEPSAFTFFTFARSIFGDDSRARNALITLAERRGWDLQSYARLSECCVGRDIGGPHHGLVSFSIARSSGTGISIGLRAPDNTWDQQ